MSKEEQVHIPVLSQELLDHLVPTFLGTKEPLWFVDCTFGGGGHTSLFLEQLGSTEHRLMAFDKDEDAIARGRKKFSEVVEQGKLELIHASFSALSDHCQGRKVGGIIADLGYSSIQLDDSARGLSFLIDGPLDMRLDRGSGPTCRQYLATVTRGELERVLKEYGEERYSRRIASRILEARAKGELPETTGQLSHLVGGAVPRNYRYGSIHCATRTFQALRIAVNGELAELDSLLECARISLWKGGRLGVISFHSLEDRKVKRAFRSRELGWDPVNKKPIVPTESEIERNPRSRSAKLRVAGRKGER